MINRKIRIRFFSFFTIACCIINLISIQPINTLSSSTGTVSAYDGDEIIILWSAKTSLEEQYRVLYELNNSLSIIDCFSGGMLCQMSDPSMLFPILQKLNSFSSVLVAEPNYELELMSDGVINDTYLDSLWSLNNTGNYTRITGSSSSSVNSVPDIDMDVVEGWSAFSETVTDPNEVVVAIIDTGIDYQHPDLAANMWVNSGEIADDDIDNDMNGYVDDIYGWDYYNEDNTICHYEYSEKLDANVALATDNDNHGTHIAGIIAATADNGIGIAGIASNIPIKLMSLKIHNGVDGKGTVENAVKAIKYATMMGADICNMSWGTTVYSKALETVMRESNMLFVVAAGNEGTNNDNLPMYPANTNLDNVISTTFIDASGELTANSNYGVSSVDIAAPGTDIFSTIVGSYSNMGGSSMAVPQVVGIAAILYSCSDHLYPASVKALLIDTLKPIPSLKGHVRYPGIPNLLQAVIASSTLLQDTEIPKLFVSSSIDKDFLIMHLTSNDTGNSGLRIIKYAYGTKTLRAFRHGTAGITVTTDEVKVAKSGDYTFYISDYAGNESITIFKLEDDIVPPEIVTSYYVSPDLNLFSVLATFIDKESGIKQVKLLNGTHTISDFLSAENGQSLTPVGNRLLLHVSEPGTYTLYAADSRGNKTVYTFDLSIIHASDVTLKRQKIVLLNRGSYQLTPIITPANTTDAVTYTSSDSSIAKVNKWGYITATGQGSAVISIICGTHKKLCYVIVP